MKRTRFSFDVRLCLVGLSVGSVGHDRSGDGLTVGLLARVDMPSSRLDALRTAVASFTTAPFDGEDEDAANELVAQLTAFLKDRKTSAEIGVAEDGVRRGQPHVSVALNVVAGNHLPESPCANSNQPPHTDLHAPRLASKCQG